MYRIAEHPDVSEDFSSAFAAAGAEAIGSCPVPLSADPDLDVGAGTCLNVIASLAMHSR